MLRERESPSQGLFAQRFDISQQSWSHYESGRSIPKADLLSKIVVATGINADWLLTGRGSMGIEKGVGPLATAAMVVDQVEAMFAPTQPRRVVQVPVFDVPLSAGDGDEMQAYLAVDSLVSYDTVYRDWLRDECHIDPERAFYAPVRGDSMEDKLFDGDWVLGERQDHIDREGMFALVLNNMLLVKHVQSGAQQGTLDLISHNQRYPTRTISEERGDVLHVIGRVVRRVTR